VDPCCPNCESQDVYAPGVRRGVARGQLFADGVKEMFEEFRRRVARVVSIVLGTVVRDL
jgi:hypothetical protein